MQVIARKPSRGQASDQQAELVYRALLGVVEETSDFARIDLITALTSMTAWEDVPETVKAFSRRLVKNLGGA